MPEKDSMTSKTWETIPHYIYNANSDPASPLEASNFKLGVNRYKKRIPLPLKTGYRCLSILFRAYTNENKKMFLSFSWVRRTSFLSFRKNKCVLSLKIEKEDSFFFFFFPNENFTPVFDGGETVFLLHKKRGKMIPSFLPSEPILSFLWSCSN